jgi:hypothetical protein
MILGQVVTENNYEELLSQAQWQLDKALRSSNKVLEVKKLLDQIATGFVAEDIVLSLFP